MKNKETIIKVTAVVALILAIIGGIVINLLNTKKAVSITSPEIARTMNYRQVEEGDEAIYGTDNVKFSAFFLRDLDEDEYAEKIEGTCKQIGAEDTLYMEINVQTEGYLKDAKIQIAGKNFYLQTALPKDEQLLNNYIGNNVKLIEFNQLNNGTQKLLTGIVRSGDYAYESTKASAIGNNINNYSREDNKIILTGTYVRENGEEVAIAKTIPLTVDWYGTTKAEISVTNQTKNDLPNRINEEEGTLKLSFEIRTEEKDYQLNLSRNHVEGTIPSLNEYAPLEVKLTNGKSENLTFSYDKGTKKFTIDRTATVEENGEITTSLSRSNSYEIEVTYPIDAYKSLGEDTVSISIPVKTYYEGYNNSNEEFTNPYKSNIAKETIVVNYANPQGTVADIDITVGKYYYNPVYRYIVSKQKPLNIYNGISEEEKDDTYIVRWHAYTGTDGETSGLIMKETKDGEAQVSDRFIKTDSTQESMENITTNVGIYFSGVQNFLKSDGWIKIYDDETGNLIETFTKLKASTYGPSNPYKYEVPVKHIRIETSETNKESSLHIYHVKELNDEYITTNYTKEQFDDLQYIVSTVNGYLGGEHIRTTSWQSGYEAPHSVATISLNKNALSTQKTEENVQIEISTDYDPEANQLGWVDGSFLVKLPEEILMAEINNVRISNSNVEITTYEIIETEEGKFIKINTTNKNNTIPAYIITIDVNLTSDPRIETATREIELYAANNGKAEYYYKSQDIYDVNNNLNTTEKINKTSAEIDLIAPNSLLTSQTASEYDFENSIVVSPQIADIDPSYAEVDTERKTAKVGVQVKNNYSSTISEIKILGKIPFEGNRTALTGNDLGSTFTTKMLDTGIEIPEELQGKVTIYYSESENPSKDITNVENGWKTQENVTDWGSIKTFLIDFENEAVETGKEYTFYYKIEIPEGLEFNKTAFSHHGIYFCLDTEEGKYRTQTEPNKLGFRIAEKFGLEIIKTQKGKEKLVAGATYSVREISQEGTVIKETTAVTNAEGTLLIKSLYAERIYEVLEVKTPSDYELSEDVIQFIGHVDEEGTLTIERLQGITKEEILVTKNNGEKHKVTVKVEDEAKSKLKITKKDQATGTILSNVKFKITGEDLPENGRILTTNANGEIFLSGLKIDEEYTLEETKADGYFLAETIKFKIVNNEGIYSIEIIEGIVLENTVTEEDSLPIANLTIENEKLPTYTLEINKIKKILETELTTEGTTEENEIVYLEGAKFKLYKGTKEIGTYITGADGKVTIDNLYESIEGREEGIYTLKEVEAPVGYAKVKDITFKVEDIEGTLTLINIEGKEEKYTSEGATVKLTVEDSPSFKLVKKDAETGELLANIKFAIYNLEDELKPAVNSKGETIGTKEIINGKEYYTVTTDENGTIIADLPEGFYKAVELQAPEKYDIENSIYYFGVGNSAGKEVAELEEEWTESIESDWGGESHSIEKTSDGGYLVAAGGVLVKYTENREEEWKKDFWYKYGYPTSINSAFETIDGDYVIAGYFEENMGDGNGTDLSSNGGYDGMLIKYSATGEVKWQTAIGGEGDDYITAAIETNDGGYIVGGLISGYEENEVTLIKYSSDGNEEWSNVIDYTWGHSTKTVVEKTIDGGYIVNSLDYDGYTVLKKYNQYGNLEWENTIYGSTIETIKQTEEGDYIVGGYFSSETIELGNGIILENDYYKNGSRYYKAGILIKYNSTGEAQWGKVLNGKSYANDSVKSIAVTEDGGFVIGIETGSQSIELDNGIILIGNGIVKYNSKGEAEGAKQSNQISALEPTKDGGFLAGGSMSVAKYNIKHVFKVEQNISTEIGIGSGSSWRYSKYDDIKVVEKTEDGGYIVGGYFASRTLNLGNGIILNNESENTDYIDYVSGETDAYLIKYNSKREIEWVKTIQGKGDDKINSLVITNDGGYLVAGEFSEEIDLGNGVILTRSEEESWEYLHDTMLIKYNSKGELEWARRETDNLMFYDMPFVKIDSIIENVNGEYLVGKAIYETGWANSEYLIDRSILKYNAKGEKQGTTSTANAVFPNTQDGGYVKGLYVSENTSIEDNITLSGPGTHVIKYDANGKIQWTQQIDEISNYGRIPVITVSEIYEGNYIVSANNTISKVTALVGSPEVQELVIENARKELKITTSINEIDGIKGGTISGEDENPYEIVKYGESNTKEIVMVADQDYEIISITVNGKEHTFTENEDETYTMPILTNITEDMDIEVTFSLKDNKITINKVDSETQEKLPGATFKLDQIDEREEPENVIGNIVANGQEYIDADVSNEATGVLGQIVANGAEASAEVDTTKEITDVLGPITGNGVIDGQPTVDTSKEITDVLGELTADGEIYEGETTTTLGAEVTDALGTMTENGEYYFTEQDGAYVSNNQNCNETTAQSYMMIDLSNKEGKYAVVVNASVSSEQNYDIGYATISENSNAPGIYDELRQFIKISGERYAQDYTSTLLEGGAIYYLHFGYQKDSSVENGNDSFTINSVKLYEIEVQTSESSTYNFIENNGKYEL